MKIPSCFYGTKPETKRECKKVARKVWEGMPLAEAVSGYELIDTEEVPECYLKIAHPVVAENNEKNFFLSWVSEYIQDKFEPQSGDKEARDRAFYQLIEYDWSILGLSEDVAANWFRVSWSRNADGRHRWQPYLRKLCDFWDVLYGVGSRYIGMGLYPETLWEANFALTTVLGYLEVPREERSSPKDPTNLRGLCEKYQLLTMDVVNNPKFLDRYPLLGE